MYQRRDPKTGRKRGNWYIRINGIRTSARTKDQGRAKRREHKENTESFDHRYGLVVPTWEKAALKWTQAFPKESGSDNNLRYAKWWLPKLKGKRLPEITRELVHGLITKHRPKVDLNKRIKPNSTANNYVKFVAQVIRYASNLNPKFIQYPPIQFSDKSITVENWWTIREKLKPDELDLATFILATGFREDNGMFFEWGWDKGTWARIPAERTKTDVPYVVPLNKTAQGILANRRKLAVRHLDYPFTIAGEAWYPLKLLRALRIACEASGVPVVTVHGLRHSFATWLAQRGVAKEIRQRLMGHGVKDVQDVYSHFDVESLRPYSEIMDSILSHPPKKNRQVAVTKRVVGAR